MLKHNNKKHKLLLNTAFNLGFRLVFPHLYVQWEQFNVTSDIIICKFALL